MTSFLYVYVLFVSVCARVSVSMSVCLSFRLHMENTQNTKHDFQSHKWNFNFTGKCCCLIYVIIVSHLYIRKALKLLFSNIRTHTQPQLHFRMQWANFHSTFVLVFQVNVNSLFFSFPFSLLIS